MTTPTTIQSAVEGARGTRTGEVGDASTVVILNPKAGSAAQAEELRDWVRQQGSTALIETAAPGHGHELAMRLADEGRERVVAAGGDGTIHEIVQGLANRNTTLGVVPLGTGNDFARTLAVGPSIRDALVSLEMDNRRSLDLLRLERPDEEAVWVFNVMSGGLGADIADRLDAGMKETLGPLAYAVSAASVLADPTEYQLRLSVNGNCVETTSALALFLANGRYCGGGMCVSPLADLEDGLVNVVTLPSRSALGVAALGAAMRAGQRPNPEGLLRLHGRSLRVESNPPMPFSIDGERIGQTPFSVSVQSKMLPCVVGPSYAREPCSL